MYAVKALIRCRIMVRKFFSTHDEDGSPQTFLPKFYFFYGSLMDPGQLARVLGLRKRPVAHPASIVGYSYKMWGPYPALTDGPLDAIVQGVAYEVKSQRWRQGLRNTRATHTWNTIVSSDSRMETLCQG
jgi:Gamma-glutamyl cyclotransferase, AIG2-like